LHQINLPASHCSRYYRIARISPDGFASYAGSAEQGRGDRAGRSPTMIRMTRASSILAAFLCLLALSACGGSASSASSTETQEPITVVPSTPLPTQSGPPLIRSSLSGECRLTPNGAQIRVEFQVTAFGSTSLTRVQLLEDGKQIDDSGVLDQRSYHRVATFDAQPGERHTYRLVSESGAGSGPSAQTTVSCGSTATPRPGPRA
jgi:hypothetical protein